MAKYTARDRLWNYTLKQTARRGEEISAADLATMAETSERSARDVLHTMEDMGIVRKVKRHSGVRFVAADFTEDDV